MSIEPTPSFPSLSSLLERLPDDGEDPYTNGSLFDGGSLVDGGSLFDDGSLLDDGCAEAAAGGIVDRPTPTTVVMSPPRAPATRSWSGLAGLAAPLAFVLGIGATLAVDRATNAEPTTAQAAGLALAVEDATANLRVVTEVAVARADVAPKAPAATPIEPAATPIEPAATPIEPAATPIEPAATPIEPAIVAEDAARAEAREALAAALLADAPTKARAFDRDAARASVNAVTRAAKACGDGELSGDASVTITFAHSGRATRAIVGGTLAGTAIGSCIANVMRGASVPAYEGDLVSVRRVVRIR